MPINSTHPDYDKRTAEWKKLRDFYDGEETVKKEGQKYLPATSGMIADGLGENQLGAKMYNAYRTRALFPEFVEDAVNNNVGLMHGKMAEIELPRELEFMRERATTEGETLDMLLRRINTAQLITGRLGLLLDHPAGKTQTAPRLYVSTYEAETIINWDDGRKGDPVLQSLNMVVLEETEQERNEVGSGDDQFEWVEIEKYRVLILGDPTENEADGEAEYRMATYRTETNSNSGKTTADSATTVTFREEALVTPKIRGKALGRIPFVFINSRDCLPTPTKAPLKGLADLTEKVYQGEADYRQTLFMQSQATLVRIGYNPDTGEEEGEEVRTGAGAVIDVDLGGDAKWIGVDGQGLEEQRKSLENDRRAASKKGGQLLDTVTRERESGDALGVRVAAETTTLFDIAMSGAAGLEAILKMAAEWLGANPNEVKVTPNLDFAKAGLDAQMLISLTTAKNQGGPISNKTIHNYLSQNEITEFTYEQELLEIENEPPLIPVLPEADPVRDE